MAQQPLYRRSRRTRLLVVGLVTASLVTITIDYRGGDRGPLAAAGRATLAVISPLQRAMSNLLRPIGGFFSTLSDLASLREQNLRLQEELNEVLAGRANEFSLQLENERLRKLLQIKTELAGVRTKPGRVIAEGVSNLEWVVTLDVGARDGVEINDPVVGPDGLIGHVVQVSANASDVQLILDPDSRVGARLPASEGELGLLTGVRNNDLRFDLVDPEVDISPGEPVVTAGLQIGGTAVRSIYPPGIPIGVVSRVLENAAALEKQVWVRPSVDFTSLDIVLVLLTD